MKKQLLSFVFVLFISSLMYSQTNSDFKVGDTFIIGNIKSDNYKHIDFPKANFIIKKGGLANYSDVIGKKVTITSIKENNVGDRIATIKLADSKKFFNSHKYITVNIEDAIKNKELLLTK